MGSVNYVTSLSAAPNSLRASRHSFPFSMIRSKSEAGRFVPDSTIQYGLVLLFTGPIFRPIHAHLWPIYSIRLGLFSTDQAQNTTLYVTEWAQAYPISLIYICSVPHDFVTTLPQLHPKIRRSGVLSCQNDGTVENTYRMYQPRLVWLKASCKRCSLF
jgi:hypothetical protein